MCDYINDSIIIKAWLLESQLTRTPDHSFEAPLSHRHNNNPYTSLCRVHHLPLPFSSASSLTAASVEPDFSAILNSLGVANVPWALGLACLPLSYCSLCLAQAFQSWPLGQTLPYPSPHLHVYSYVMFAD